MANQNSVRVPVRYYCPRDENHRCFPYDQYESFTEAPTPGKRGGNILLRSHNSSRRDGHKLAWCWACGGWVSAFARTQPEIIRMYLEREGVRFRMPVPKEEAKRRVGNLMRRAIGA